jgi:hypothetical protein
LLLLITVDGALAVLLRFWPNIGHEDELLAALEAGAMATITPATSVMAARDDARRQTTD